MNPDIIIKLAYFLGKNLKEAVLDHSTKEVHDDPGDRPYSTGYDYLQQKNYVMAVRYFRLSADRGNASAQLSLGLRYGFGQGVAQDYEQAAKWLQLAANQGHPKAQAMLACLYGSGTGVAKDRNRALELIKSAMKSGHPAQDAYQLGCLCQEGGAGLEPDYVVAYAWFSMAASQGYREAESKRASMAGKITSADRAFVDNLLFSRSASGDGSATDRTTSHESARSEWEQSCSNCADRFATDDRYCKNCGKQRASLNNR